MDPLAAMSGIQFDSGIPYVKMISIPEEELENLKEKNRRQAHVITDLQRALDQRNLDLDALHFVWCDGGCTGGVHRYTHDAKLTEEMIQRAERNTKRLRSWYNTVKLRIKIYQTLHPFVQRLTRDAASKTDLTLPL